MGWKAFKEHFAITHILSVDGNTCYIGSPYVFNLVSVDMLSGARQVNRVLPDFLVRHYPLLEAASDDLVVALFAQVDEFGPGVPVFSCVDGRIVEHRCETPGWPNVTHEGELMFNNEFFVERAKAVSRARISAVRTLDGLGRSIDGRVRDILVSLRYYRYEEEKMRRLFAEEGGLSAAEIEKLGADYPLRPLPRGVDALGDGAGSGRASPVEEVDADLNAR